MQMAVSAVRMYEISTKFNFDFVSIYYFYFFYLSGICGVTKLSF